MKKLQKAEKAAVVKGALALENAAALRVALLDAFSSHERVVFRPDSIQRRFGCVQLLCAAFRHASALGKQFAVEGPAVEGIDEMFREAGFAPVGFMTTGGGI